MGKMMLSDGQSWLIFLTIIQLTSLWLVNHDGGLLIHQEAWLIMVSEQLIIMVNQLIMVYNG